MWSRIAALPRAARLHLAVERARRSEGRALALAGDQACGIPELGAPAEIAGAVAGASPLRERRDAARRAAEASFDQDRTDWADASPSLKVLILARGLLVRAVLRAQRRRIERELAPLLERIGAHALAAPSVAARLPEPALAEVERQRARAGAASAERAELLAPLGGRALPPSFSAAARETSRVAAGLGQELRARLLPRLPGLAGLVAGWWVAHAFTSSRWDAFTERLGLRRGGPWVVSGETYERLEFWIPLVAAALCGYLGSRVWAAVERRYAAPPPRQEGEDVPPVSSTGTR
jgi:hypothetical protein